jgi:hypothetical protein
MHLSTRLTLARVDILFRCEKPYRERFPGQGFYVEKGGMNFLDRIVTYCSRHSHRTRMTLTYGGKDDPVCVF